MRRTNLAAGAVLVLLALGLSLTFDPFGVFDTAVEDGYQDPGRLGAGSDAPSLAGREGPAPEPRSFEGDPVGILDLGAGGATLTGAVTGSGQPLALARVRPVLPPPQADRAVRTRRDGTFEIRGLPPGTHEVRASADGWHPRTVAGPTLADGGRAEAPPIDLDPRLPVRNGIEVRVTDEWGRPIAGARVLATTMPWDLHLAMGPDLAGVRAVHHRSAHTDEAGRARLEPLEAEDYNVVATARGYTNGVVNGVPVAEGRTRPVHLRLKDACTLSGRVLDREGQPVEGAVVMGMSMGSFVSSLTARTEADGSFLLDGLRQGAYMVIAWDEQRGQVTAQAQAPGQGLVVRLEGTGTLKVRVRWEDGSPVSAGQVRPFQTGPFQYVYSMVVPLGPDGGFETPWPPGNWTLRAQAADGCVAPDQVAPVKVGETTEVEIVMPRTGVVRGVVVDEAGRHVAGAEVFVRMGGFPPGPSREQYARSDADGRFEVPGLDLEPVVLHVTHPEHADTKVSATPAPPEGAPELTVRLTRGATLAGRVLDAQGRGVAGEQVNLIPPQSFFDAVSVFTDAEGAFAFPGLAPGGYSLTTGPYEQGARGLSRQGIAVGDSGVVTVDLVHPPAEGLLTGEVRAAGQPVAGAEVTVQDDRGPEQAHHAVTDEQGRFAVEGLQLGRVQVSARTAAGQSGSASVTVGAGAPASVTVELGSAQVAGRVLDESGRPVSGAWISLEADEDGHTEWSRMRWQGNSSPDGTFLARGLRAGRLRVRVNRPEYAQYLGEPFALAEGEARALGDLRLRRGAILAGTVRDDSGVPIEDATIGVRDAQGRPVFLFSMSTTGSDGRYSLRGLEPGSYRVAFEARGHAPAEVAVTLTAEGGTADATLTRGGAVVVRVEDEAGQPVAGARIFLYDARGQLVTRTISLANFDNGSRSTDAQGTARLDDLAAGTYRAQARKEGWVETGPEGVARVDPGAVVPVRLLLRAGP